MGDGAFVHETSPISYVTALIQSQADEGADYIAVNVDGLSGADGLLAARLMRQYVRVVRRSSGGIPVCIDSRFSEAVIAGLEEWYEADGPVRPPLAGPVRADTADELLSLRQRYDFSLVAQLDEASSGKVDVDGTIDQARQLLEKAMSRFGFGSEQIFFDPVAVPLVNDEPTLPGGRGRTHTAFEMIRRIKGDSSLKRSHCVLRISNMAQELPGRAIGVCRAYVAAAMEYGLDAAFVDVSLHFGESPADPRLLELVDACAKMDGAPERTRNAKELMAKFCAEVQKPRRPAAAPALSKS
jgi:cobalamin-dependent methionine synthase I